MAAGEFDPGTATAWCRVCQPAREFPAGEILDHLRNLHPAEYGDGPECWPDGGFVIMPDGEAMNEALADLERADGDD